MVKKRKPQKMPRYLKPGDLPASHNQKRVLMRFYRKFSEHCKWAKHSQHMATFKRLGKALEGNDAGFVKFLEREGTKIYSFVIFTNKKTVQEAVAAAKEKRADKIDIEKVKGYCGKALTFYKMGMRPDYYHKPLFDLAEFITGKHQMWLKQIGEISSKKYFNFSKGKFQISVWKKVYAEIRTKARSTVESRIAYLLFLEQMIKNTYYIRQKLETEWTK